MCEKYRFLNIYFFYDFIIIFLFFFPQNFEMSEKKRKFVIIEDFKDFYMIKYIFEYFEDYSIVYLEGQCVGGEEVNQLSELLDDLQEKKNKNLIIDLEKVPFISSIVIGLFIKFHNTMFEKNIKIAFINANSAITDIFKITRVDLRLNVFSNLQEAFEYFKI